MKARLPQILLPAVIGAAVALSGAVTTAITAAIAAPAWFFRAFGFPSLLPVRLLAWDLLVVHGLAITLPSIALLVLAYRRGNAPTLAGSALFLVAALAVVYVGYPALFGGPSLLSVNRPWWGYGLEASLVLSAVLSWLAARALGRRAVSIPRP